MYSPYSTFQTPDQSPWSENVRRASSPRSYISEDSLTLFRNWLHTNAAILPGYDHAMAVTAYDLHNDGKLQTLYNLRIIT